MPSSDILSAAGYGRGDRLFHRLALASRAALETSFDVERAIFGRRARALEIGAPVFVCGLARAGTTILTRLLHDTGAFASPTYRDLPFPLAPNAWARLSRPARRKVAARARGHADGLLHDLDSPEAIEEVFWRCFEGENYLLRDGLRPAPPTAETLAFFRDYVALVQLRYARPRYLSKNNNNILRLPALAGCFPTASFVHPFRDPAQQAASLLRQHRSACRLHEEDPFRRKFMSWLGHHEFGAEQRPFLLPGAPDAALHPNSLNYWLAAWLSVYSHLLSQTGALEGRQIFVEYETLLEHPAPTAARLARATGVEPSVIDMGALRPPAPHEKAACDPALLERARDLHRRLRLRVVQAEKEIDAV